jgi:glycosyltransferase involved in cell wall biosynthesis
MDERSSFPGKVGLQQRVLPSYRVAFFDHLAERCQGGLSVFAGLPRQRENIGGIGQLKRAIYAPARNLHLLAGPLYLCYQMGLIRWLEAWNPQVLILEANPRYLSNLIAIRWMHRRGRGVIGWGLGATPLKGPLSRARIWARHEYLSVFDRMIAYSSIGAQQYAQSGVAPGKVSVAINAATAPPKRLLQREPLQGRAARVLFVGRLQARKRVDLLLRACAEEETKPDLWVVGEGPELHALQKMAAEIHPRTHFTGAKHGTELERLFDQADLFVLPGTGGLAVQEAMAHGLAVIVAEGDGTQQDLVSNQNGWLIKGNDLPALKNALKEALSNPEGLRQKGEASYRLVAERVNIHSMAETFIEALNDVAGKAL